MVKFIVWTTILTAFVLLLVEASGNMGWFELPSYRYAITFYLSSWTAAMGGFLVRKLEDPAIDFTRQYLLVMVIRMFLFAAFILVIIFWDRAGAATNAAFFMITYFLFTGFEVGFLVFKTRLKSGSQQPQKDH